MIADEGVCHSEDEEECDDSRSEHGSGVDGDYGLIQRGLGFSNPT